MTKDDAIVHICQTHSIAAHAIEDYSRPADGFCKHCPSAMREWTFRNDGHILKYVRKAVIAQLIRDGYSVPAIYRGT